MRAKGARALAATALALAWARPSEASPSYPSVLMSVSGSEAPPPCTVCHESLAGGFGTATKPLAVYLRSRGLMARNETALRGALSAAAGEKSDVDMDGASDLDELRAGTDPNGGSADALEPPAYGCGNLSGGRPTNAPFRVLILLGAVGVARRLSRRRAPR